MGVAAALVSGGPGAIFWMWVASVTGMATKYAEIILAMHFREKDNNGIWRRRHVIKTTRKTRGL